MDIDRREQALQRARAELERHVTEPPRGVYVNAEGTLLRKRNNAFTPIDGGQDVPHESMHILKYIEEGLAWPALSVYRNTGSIKGGGFSWCGAFAMYCYVSLKKKIRYDSGASTYRLYELCKRTPRDIPIEEVQRGDVVIVGKKSSRRWGAHIVLCTHVHPTHIDTIEGNAHGHLTIGSWGEGVVYRTRPFKAAASQGDAYIMHVYRFLEEDYT